jgi:hypothetical protein
VRRLGDSNELERGDAEKHRLSSLHMHKFDTTCVNHQFCYQMLSGYAGYVFVYRMQRHNGDPLNRVTL